MTRKRDCEWKWHACPGLKKLILAYPLFPRREVTKQVLLVSMALNWFEIFFVWKKQISPPPSNLSPTCPLWERFPLDAVAPWERFCTHLRRCLNFSILSIIQMNLVICRVAYCWSHIASYFLHFRKAALFCFTGRYKMFLAWRQQLNRLLKLDLIGIGVQEQMAKIKCNLTIMIGLEYEMHSFILYQSIFSRSWGQCIISYRLACLCVLDVLYGTL